MKYTVEKIHEITKESLGKQGPEPRSAPNHNIINRDEGHHHSPKQKTAEDLERPANV